jgi:hypothetical protein
VSRRLSTPQFPLAPKSYDQRYMDSVVQSFSVYLEQYQNPGQGRHTQLTLTNLPENDYGLEIGALFTVDGFVKIVRPAYPHPAGVSGTGIVGSVTVSTS